MLPGRFSLQLYRGDSAAYQFLIWADRQGQTPLDITGAAVLAEIRDRPGGVLLSTLVSSIEAPNIVRIQVNASQSRALPHKAFWDLQLTFGTGEVLTPLAGGVAVTDDVSASTSSSLPPGDFVPLPFPDTPPQINPQDGESPHPPPMPVPSGMPNPPPPPSKPFNPTPARPAA